MARRNRAWSWIAGGLGIAALLGGAIIVNENAPSINTGSQTIGSLDIDNGDVKINWDRYATYDIELDGTLTITKEGTYHLTGFLNDGAVIIKLADNGVARLILDNVTIKNSSGPAIACYSADDLVIELVGDNIIEDGEKYSAEYDEDVTGAIYTKSDLTFQGDGTLDITANYQDGIISKDDLKIASGTYKVVAADDGIRGKDSVYITGGSIDISSKGDGIKATNDATAGKGFVLIEGGDIAISSGDDGIHAENILTIQDGTIDVAKSYEGLEAQKIIINDGDISIKASDDGINAGGGSDTSTAAGGMMDSNSNCELTINGGKLYVNAAGDGIDSNGYLYFNGGDVVVDGPTNNGNGALDAGIGINMTGGSVIALGASGMAENLGASSTVNNISVYFSSTQKAGTKVEIKDSDGQTILSHTSAKTFNHLAAGSEEFKTGETYTIYLNGTEYESFTVLEVVTTVGTSTTNNNMIPGQNRR